MVGGEADQSPWVADVTLDGYPMKFHIDTGAEVTVISERAYTQFWETPLLPSDRTLRDPSQKVLPTKGRFQTNLQAGNRNIKQYIYVVSGLHQPLLGRPAAIEALKPVARVNAIEEVKKPQDLYPQLFTGLGKLEQEYHIKLKEGAKPYAINAPHGVAIPLNATRSSQGNMVFNI